MKQLDKIPVQRNSDIVNKDKMPVCAGTDLCCNTLFYHTVTCDGNILL